ncbi:AbrB/MazE/SpoVT family DNA-binding domain-containing protein [Paraclostridium sordellii]|uniref:AbrB/MazE/SpoVT family DNA-binding domain-containing protein n=1 Tax=Paraclostridium sordellii TaxID=1505 RepID=UPI0005DD76CD|nr:AbrB/MazE/SpoVT family DNA-binding domain-containing protein [Paeniclostridium sordellii]CEP80294.1 putative PemI [[Clostridium] sordellii] [Paeniclostridium sordellii]
MDPVEKNISFNKGGNGGYTLKLGIPLDFANELGLTKEENKVMLTLEDGSIVIRKKEN